MLQSFILLFLPVASEWREDAPHINAGGLAAPAKTKRTLLMVLYVQNITSIQTQSFSHSESRITNIIIQNSNRRRVAAQEDYEGWESQKNKMLRSRLISHIIIIYICTQSVIAIIMVLNIIIVVYT